jgi:hypothetical protein
MLTLTDRLKNLMQTIELVENILLEKLDDGEPIEPGCPPLRIQETIIGGIRERKLIIGD